MYVAKDNHIDQFKLKNLINFRGIAQLAERQSPKLCVRGSSPFTPASAVSEQMQILNFYVISILTKICKDKNNIISVGSVKPKCVADTPTYH